MKKRYHIIHTTDSRELIKAHQAQTMQNWLTSCQYFIFR